MIKTSTLKRFLSVKLSRFPMLAAADHADAKTEAASSAVVEVASPPSDFNTSAAALRTVAESEIKKDRSLFRSRRRVVISFSLSLQAGTSATPTACNVNATVRDARTGAMIAIVESATRAEGPLSPELRKEMADAAVRTAVHRVPSAIRAKK